MQLALDTFSILSASEEIFPNVIGRQNRMRLGASFDRSLGNRMVSRATTGKRQRQWGRDRRCGSPRPILRLSFLSTFILLRKGARMLLSPLLLCCGDALPAACLPWWWWWWWWWWCWWWWWWYGSLLGCCCCCTLAPELPTWLQQRQGWLLLLPLITHSPDTPINVVVLLPKESGAKTRGEVYRERDGQTEGERERERYAGGRWSFKVRTWLTDDRTFGHWSKRRRNYSFRFLHTTVLDYREKLREASERFREENETRLGAPFSNPDSSLIRRGNVWRLAGSPCINLKSDKSEERPRVTATSGAWIANRLRVSRRAPWDDWLFSVAERESIAATRASRRPMIPRRSPPVSRWWKHMEGWLAPGGQLPLTWPRCTRPPRDQHGIHRRLGLDIYKVIVDWMRETWTSPR